MPGSHPERPPGACQQPSATHTRNAPQPARRHNLASNRLAALNARNGTPISSFGKDGLVDLKVGVVKGRGEQIDLETGEIGVHSTPSSSEM